MVSFFWQKGFYFNGQLFFYSNLTLKSLSTDNFGLGLYFIKFYVNRLELFEEFNFSRNLKNLTPHDKFLNSFDPAAHYLLTHYLVNSFPVLLSIRQQTKFNLFKFYLLRTSRGLSLRFNKPISRKSRTKTFSKSTPKAHMRKRSNTSLWFKIMICHKILFKTHLNILFGISKLYNWVFFQNLTYLGHFLLSVLLVRSGLSASTVRSGDALAEHSSFARNRLPVTLNLLTPKFRIFKKKSFVLYLFKMKKIFDARNLVLFFKNLDKINALSSLFNLDYGNVYSLRRVFFRKKMSLFFYKQMRTPLTARTVKSVDYIFSKNKRNYKSFIKSRVSSGAGSWVGFKSNIRNILALTKDAYDLIKPLHLSVLINRRVGDLFNVACQNKPETLNARTFALGTTLFSNLPTTWGLTLTTGSKPVFALKRLVTKIKKSKKIFLNTRAISAVTDLTATSFFSFREADYHRFSTLSFWTNQLSFVSTFKKFKFQLNRVREFRLSQSEILNSTALRRKIIQYNLKNEKTFIESLRGWSSSFRTSITSVKSDSTFFVTRSNSFRFLDEKCFDKGRAFFRKTFSKFLLTAKASKRVRTLWVSKITQLSLDPFRREFMILHRKNFRYQKRITRFIMKYYRFKVLEFMQNLEFRLLTLLPRIAFVNTLSESKSLIKDGFVFVNGVKVTSLDFEVYFYDMLQLPISYRFLIYMRWCRLTIISKFNRFLFFVKYWRKRSFRPFPKQSSYRIPYWVKHSIMFKESKPLYVDIDFLTFTCLILRLNYFNPLIYNYFSFYQMPLASVRAFNWKSLT